MRVCSRNRLGDALLGEPHDQTRSHGRAYAAHRHRRHQDLSATLSTGITGSAGSAHAYLSADDDSTLRPIGTNVRFRSKI